jgi:hypothetical protein
MRDAVYVITIAVAAAVIAWLASKTDRLTQRVEDLAATRRVQHDFQLVQLGQMRRDQFLIDRRTGRIWVSVCSGKNNGPDCMGMMIWDEMYVRDFTPNDSPVAIDFFAHRKREWQKDARTTTNVKPQK